MQQEPFLFPCRLHSHGKLYTAPTIPDGDIKIRPIRGEQEELLAGAGEGLNATIMLREVSQQLIVLPDGFPFPELLVSDWVTAMFNIMAASYSPSLTLTPACPKCGEVLHEVRTLAQLECASAEDFGEKYKEPFQVESLPISKESVEFRLLRLRDMQRIEEYSLQYKGKKFGAKVGDPTYTYTLAMHIHSINGNTSLPEMERMKWVRRSIAGDLHYLRREIEKWDTGYSLRPEFTCPSCHHVFRTQVPLDFFRSFSAQD